VVTSPGEIIAIVACVVLSALFSGSETALTSLSALKVEQLIDTKPFWGRALRIWHRNHAGVLTSILIGNTFATVAAGAIAGDIAEDYLTGTGVSIAVGAMTVLLLIVGEVVPKTLARAYSEQMSIPLMNYMAVIHFVIFPITWVLTRVVRWSISLFGGQLRPNAPISEEDIEYIISVSHRQGGIDREKQQMLTSIFDFTDTTAKEIMLPRTDVTAIAVDTPLDDVVKICIDSEYSRLPVYEDSIDKIVGIFYAKDLIRDIKKEERATYVRDRMRPPVFVPETKKLNELLKQFQQERVHLAIVVNEFGGTEGIVTLEDVIEEVIGEIRDEFDDEERLLVPIAAGGYMADAKVNIDDLRDTLKVPFPEEREYETLGGFLMEVAGQVPDAGWQTMHQGFRFTVTQAEENRVVKVRIMPVRAQPSPVQPGSVVDDNPPRIAATNSDT
jgi:CBS domain containing-hemolysin-like protein